MAHRARARIAPPPHGTAALLVIPVIDLLDGCVVHARRGDRANYRPIETPLARSADPVAVVDGLVAYAPVSILYVADLDAIAGRARNEAALRRVREAHPDLRLWLDAGYARASDIPSPGDFGALDVVLGTESLPDLDRYAALVNAAGSARCVLSLDRSGAERLGCAALFEAYARWPARVIDMNLGAVGAAQGPDLVHLESLLSAVPHCRVYAAGGVRGDEDLRALHESGAAGALVATALHSGRITPAGIAAVSTG